ncbi:large conductance mechanosensitive channel protein MscL [Actinomarinicola tropica]|uniref:Large-conductance mechanosensitive channel n=1 Tax=Actinomarinicola tropica TaxID=2789776 RepID=A0A5Q2RFZ8_9ACTN|nr:large conductance mechanosensitive channel protein MscL [Actinomarinicola tropica]QGG95759.1 large conductance mechanosensitive channel protein MscL [Actinomarinicola tropica]
MSWLKEFKEFINRGNVVDLAVAVVLAAAFGAVVTSFVDDILMQIIAALGGQPDFSALTIDIGDGQIRYGAFLTALISFLIIAWAVFLVVKAINRMQTMRMRGETPVEEEPAPTPEQVLLAEIRDLLAAQQGGAPPVI